MTNQPILSVCITTYFGTNINDFKRMIYSLFNELSTSDKFVNKMYAKELLNKLNGININVNELTEVIVFIDGLNSSIKEFINSLTIDNIIFTIIESKNNIKVSMARNSLISCARGKFIVFRDDDDISVNINELLRIISLHSSYCYIECYMLNFNKSWTNEAISTMYMPTNIIVDRMFLIDNNLYFVPEIGNEDMIWRSDIYNALINTSASIAMVKESIYAYLKPSNRSISYKLDPYTNTIDKYYEDIMSNNDHAYSIIARILFHEKHIFGKIPFNSILFRSINIIAAISHSNAVINQFIKRHDDMFDNKEFIDIVNNIHGEIDFWLIEDELMREECFKMFCKAVSFADLYKMSMYLEFADQREAIKTMNIFYNIKDAYKHFKTFGQQSFKLLNRFTYRYIGMKYIMGFYIDNNVLKLLSKKTFNKVKSYLTNIKINNNDLILFIHGVWSRITNKSTISNHEYHKVISLLGKCKDINEINNSSAINMYKSMNNISTYNLNVNKFDYGINIELLVSMILTPLLIDNNIDYSIERCLLDDSKYSVFYTISDNSKAIIGKIYNNNSSIELQKNKLENVKFENNIEKNNLFNDIEQINISGGCVKNNIRIHYLYFILLFFILIIFIRLICRVLSTHQPILLKMHRII